MTNFDKIKAMNTDEMAGLISGVTSNCRSCLARRFCSIKEQMEGGSNCRKHTKEYLESED